MRRVIIGITLTAVVVAGVVFWPRIAERLNPPQNSERDLAAKLLADSKWQQAAAALDALIAKAESQGSEQPDGELHYLRGRARLGAGDRQGAVDDLTIAIEQRPEDIEPRYYRGIAYERLGMAERAKTDYDEARKLDPLHKLETLESNDRLAAELRAAEMATNRKAGERVTEQRDAEKAKSEKDAQREAAKGPSAASTTKSGKDGEPRVRTGLRRETAVDATADGAASRTNTPLRNNSITAPSALDVLTQSSLQEGSASRDGKPPRDPKSSRDAGSDVADDPLSLKSPIGKSPRRRSSLGDVGLNNRRLSPSATASIEPPTLGKGDKTDRTAGNEDADELPEAPPPRQTSTALDAPGMSPYLGAGPGAGLIGPAIPQSDSAQRGLLGGVAGAAIGARPTGNTGYAGNLSGAAIGPVTLVGQAIPSIIPQASQSNGDANAAQGDSNLGDFLSESRYPIQRWTAPIGSPLVAGAQSGALTRNTRGDSNARSDSNARGVAGGVRSRSTLGPATPGGSSFAENPVARILRGPRLYGPSIATPNVSGIGSPLASNARTTSAATTPTLGGGLSTANSPLERPLESTASAPGAPRQGAFSTETQPLPAAPISAAAIDLLPGQQPLSLPR